MSGGVEKTYGSILKYIKFAVNPLKETIINTECQIHKFINMQALAILKNDNYLDAYSLYDDYIVSLNNGVVWADQEFRSMGHFYSPSTQKGLYGNANALTLAVEYYRKAMTYWGLEDNDRSLFYLGAAIHLVQDMTVPQHANLKLLDSHKKYENFIKRTFLLTAEFKAYNRGDYYMKTINEAIICNARIAVKIYSRLKSIEDEEKRFYSITKFILPLAQRTTAGCLLMFYRDVANPIPSFK